MKWLNLFRSRSVLAVVAAGLAGGASLAQTPAFTISPAVITNDFVGKIVFTITGLTNGQQVGLQKWTDLNSNGVIDPDDFLVLGFKVTDGKAPMIGGVRNTAQPGDEDGATNGLVTTKLNCPGVNLMLDLIAGNFLYRLVDPTQTPAVPFATNTFTVLPKAQSQGVTGLATAADTGAPLTNAIIALIIPDGPGGVVTMADANGQFTVNSPPGDYALLAFRNGYVANQQAGQVTVVSNSFTTKNLTNLAATCTLSGSVADFPTGLTIGGIFVGAESQSGLMTIGFTDKSGNYSFPVTADQWRVKIDEDSGLALSGHVLDQSVNSISTNTLAGSVSNLNFVFPKANAMFYGTLRDDQSNAVPALTVTANDAGYRYTSRILTGTNGRYSLAVYASGSGQWTVGPDNESLAGTGLIGVTKNLSITNGQVLSQDFTLHRITAHLRGRVVDNLGSPLGDTRINVNRGFGSNQISLQLSPVTASDGTFDVGLYGGNWSLQLECSGASSSGAIGPSLEFTLADGVDQNNITMIAQLATGNINGTIRDNTGHPQSAQVYAVCTLNGTNYNACSGNDISSSFQIAVFPGVWQIGISGDITSSGFDNPPDQTLTVTGTNTPATITLYPLGQTPPRLFAPYYNSGSFHGMLLGSRDITYRIEATTSLASSNNWVPVWTNTVQGDWFDFWDFNPPGQPSKFYRAVRLSP